MLLIAWIGLTENTFIKTLFVGYFYIILKKQDLNTFVTSTYMVLYG